MALSQAQLEIIEKRRGKVREALAMLDAGAENLTALVNRVALECGVSATVVYADIRALKEEQAEREERP